MVSFGVTIIFGLLAIPFWWLMEIPSHISLNLIHWQSDPITLSYLLDLSIIGWGDHSVAIIICSSELSLLNFSECQNWQWLSIVGFSSKLFEVSYWTLSQKTFDKYWLTYFEFDSQATSSLKIWISELCQWTVYSTLWQVQVHAAGGDCTTTGWHGD